MPPAGFEPAISESERLQTLALGRWDRYISVIQSTMYLPTQYSYRLYAFVKFPIGLDHILIMFWDLLRRNIPLSSYNMATVRNVCPTISCFHL
jgi:hypothetical protein